ncbi:MAG: FeoA family protein [Terrimicrobiaceae bacterium]|nr:FeoA family protein [Terrimicrobiaceae bacterium]
MNFDPAARTVCDLLPGEWATVSAINHDAGIGRRLLSLGLMPGCRLRLLRRAPLGDPIMVELPGCVVCLRRLDALSVSVQEECLQTS